MTLAATERIKVPESKREYLTIDEIKVLIPITSFTLGRSLRLRTSGTPGFHGLAGGVYTGS